MSEYIAAIDQSTHNTQCVIFNRQGQIAGQYALKHRQIHPETGWLEHYPLEIWANTQVVIREAMDQAGINAGNIAAVGIANQRETTIVWDRHTGRPYYNAIVWRDIRSVDICHELSLDGGQNRFRDKVGLPITTYFSAPKLLWLLNNVPGLREAALRGNALFGNIDSWLVWNLTGGPDGGAHITDATNASRTMLMNLKTLHWDNDIIKACGIPKTLLPQIRPSSDPNIYGFTTPDGPFGGKIPVCGILGSQQAATVGHLCLNPYQVKNSYDGASFIIMNTGPEIVPSKHGLLTTVCYKFGDEPAIYGLEGSIAFTGLIIEWLRDNLGLIKSVPDAETVAQTVPDNGGVYFVPAFKGLFAPYWRTDARAALVGLTHHTNRGHIVRAALEAIAYQTRDVLDAMMADLANKGASLDTLEALKVDGELTTNNLLMQFQADLLGVPVIRPQVVETTALGAAYAAGLAVGFWQNIEELAQHWGIDTIWHPDESGLVSTKLYKNWQKAVPRSFGWIEDTYHTHYQMQSTT